MRPRRFGPLQDGLLLLVALVLQIGLVVDLRVWGASGDLMLALVLAVALLDGADKGATWGFVAGVAYDLVLDTPFGLSALTYAVVGYLAGAAASAMVRPAGWWPAVIAGVSGGLAVAFYAVVGNLVGVGNPLGGLWQVAVVVGAWSAALVLPLRALLRRLFGRTEPDRIAVAFRGPSMKGVS